MDRKLLLTACYLVSVVAGCAQVGRPSPEQLSKEKRIDELFSQSADSGEFSGAVLVAQGDQIVLRKGYGFANYEEQIPNTPETLFSIQSISKLYTHVAILMEEDRGRVSLDDPIQRYVPGFPRGDDITIRHLLYHRSGVLHYLHDLPDHIYGSLSEPISLKELIDEFAAVPLRFEPGTQYGYSNAGYSLLASVIEETSGTPFDQYLQANIFTPVEMHETKADWSNSVPGVAVGYEKAQGELIRSPADHVSYYVGAAGVYSTVDDLLRWYQAVYTDGSMRKFSMGGADGYGMGYRAKFVPVPSLDIAIIILSNYMDAPLEDLAGDVAAILLEDTTFVSLEQADTDALIGQYLADSGYGVFSLSIYGGPERLSLSVNHPFGGPIFFYELRPISAYRFAFLERGRPTGQTLTINSEDDAAVREILVDLNMLQLKATRSD